MSSLSDLSIQLDVTQCIVYIIFLYFEPSIKSYLFIYIEQFMYKQYGNITQMWLIIIYEY